MTQLSKSKTVIIYFDDWEFELFMEYAESLLSKKNQQLKKGVYFKKSSLIPSNLIYFTSFLNARYLYDDHNALIEKYKFLTGELGKISINHFFNLISLLAERNIYKLNGDTIFNYIEEAGKRSNHLKQKETVNNSADFISKIL